MTTWYAILDAVSAIPIGLMLAGLALLVGVPGLAVWAGWSRNRDCERRGWKGVSRF